MHPGTTDVSDGLLGQLLCWIADRPRTYGETMEAWRTSCPRISVWEDVTIAGLVATESAGAGGQGQVRVVLTRAGQERMAAVPGLVPA